MTYNDAHGWNYEPTDSWCLVQTNGNTGPWASDWYGLGQGGTVAAPCNCVYQAVIQTATGSSQAQIQVSYQAAQALGGWDTVWDSPAAQAKRDERLRKQKEAEKRAEELLLICLPQEQREAYLRDGYIEVNVDTRKYRIHKGWAGNVELIGADGLVDAKYCIHAHNMLPTSDNMLAQALMLETDEAEFLRIANRTRIRIPSYPDPV